MRILLTIAGVAALAGWACGRDTPVGPSTPLGAHLRYVSGNAQVVDSLNTDVPRPLIVQALDRDGNPLGGATVTWSLRHGNGRLAPQEPGTTDSTGYASTLWHLGTKADTADASLGAGRLSESTRISFHTVMRFDIRLAKTSGDNQEVPYGQEMKDPVVVRVTDVTRGGAAVPGVAVHWETSPPELTPVAVDSITDEQGFARARFRTTCYYVSPSIGVKIVGQYTAFALTSVAGPATRVAPVIAGTLEGKPPLLGAGDTVTATATAFDACNAATPTPATWQTSGNARVESPSQGVSAASALLRTTTPGTFSVTTAANGMTGSLQLPVAARLGGIVQVGVGEAFSCALDGSGDVWCWGGGAASLFATRRVAGQRYKQIAVGSNHACALDESGRASCWGMPSDADPEPVQTDARFTKLSAGSSYTCGLTTAQAAICWTGSFGHANQDGSPGARPTPVVIPSEEPFSDIAVGYYYTCALAAGTPSCWVRGEAGPPVKLDTPVPFARLASSGECALTGDGVLYCWWSLVVSRVEGPAFRSAAVGYNHSCASTLNGDVYCWGSNQFYAAGALTESFIPAPKLIADPDVRGQVITGPVSEYSCVLTLEAEVRCWGKVGALGNLRSNTSCVLTRALQLPCRLYGLPVLVKPD